MLSWLTTNRLYNRMKARHSRWGLNADTVVGGDNGGSSEAFEQIRFSGLLCCMKY